MSTPHRGLPMPGPMALPDPRIPHSAGPPPQSQHYAPLSAQHAHAQGEERAENWYYVAKTEEDKRRQEEEKTRQEELKLEQRRIERDMLHQSMEAGVPPQLLPMIFAAIGGGNGPGVAMEMFQTYLAQIQQQLTQQNQPPTVQATSHLSPELRRETRNIGHLQHTAFAQPTPPAPPAAGHTQMPINAAAYPSPAYASPSTRSGGLGPPTSNGYPGTSVNSQKSLSISSLPRLTTNEAQVHSAPSGPLTYMMEHQGRASPSPSIYFHHWQPPSTQTAPTTIKEPQKTSPNQQSHLYASEQASSPRKRKATGPHQPAPPPSSAPKTTSPSFSEKSSMSRRHGRRDSDQTSRGYDPVGRLNRQTSRRNSSQEEGKSSAKDTPEGRISQEPQTHRPQSSKSES